MKNSVLILMMCVAIISSLAACDVNGTRDRTADSNSGAAMSDGDLKNAVKAKIDSDATLKAANIDVDADGDRNEVTLSGRVESQTLRSRAVELARSAHSGLVVNDKIDVISNDVSRRDYTEERARAQRERASQRGETIGDSIDDAWIHTKISSKLLANPDTPQRKINVDVNNNTVTLRGTVSTQAEKDEAEQTARTTDGVRRVVNQIRVESSSSAAKR